jgi:hypothetical protein
MPLVYPTNHPTSKASSKAVVNASSKATRNASIFLDGEFIGYPIENYVYQLGDSLCRQIVNDFLAISRAQSKSTFSSIKLAQRIAKDKEISTKEAVELLSSASEDNQELLYDYVDQLEELQSKTIGAVEQQVAFVTLFMQYRAEVKLPRSKDWQRTEDWTTEDTEKMPTKVMEEVFKFITWEREGWPQDDPTEGNEEPQES